MHTERLSIYLNDHLAGSTVALELLDDLCARFPDSEIANVAESVKKDVTADRRELESIMSRLHVEQSTIRKASAWANEKLLRAKMYLDDSKTGPLRLLEAIEAISLGIEGKRGLWVILQSLSNDIPELGRVDYEQLIHRAEEQRARLEPHRKQAAFKAIVSEQTND
jgi:hypothetical protein